MLGQFAGQDQPDRGLDLSRRDGRLLVVRRQLRGLGCDSLEDVWDRRVRSRPYNRITISDGWGSPLTNEFRIDMARFEIPVSGWTCLRTGKMLALVVQAKNTPHHVMSHAKKDEPRPGNQPGRQGDAILGGDESGRERTHLCRCRTSRSPFWSWSASSCHPSRPPSSFQPPSSRPGPFRPGPCPRSRWASSQRQLSEAFLKCEESKKTDLVSGFKAGAERSK